MARGGWAAAARRSSARFYHIAGRPKCWTPTAPTIFRHFVLIGWGRIIREFGWLNEHQFLDAVAVAMITPGPVVITVAFIGFLVAGLAGSIMAAIGIFLPVYLFTIIPAPWFKRHRNNPQLKAFVDGATAAATGAITGAVIVLAATAVTDLPTAIIAMISFAVL